MKKIDLMFCPFCGATAKVKRHSSPEAACVECENCAAQGPSFGISLEESACDCAAEAWNKRISAKPA